MMGIILNYTKSFEKFVPFRRTGNYFLKELNSELPLSTFSISEIILSIINSHFYFWGGESHPSGHTFNSSTKLLDGTIINKPTTNNKFHGFYTVDKITDSDYKLVDRDLFNRLFENAINSFSDDEPNFLHEARKYINEYLTDKCLIFNLDIDGELEYDKRDEHSVYGIFEGFFIINRSQNKVAILEVCDE